MNDLPKAPKPPKRLPRWILAFTAAILAAAFGFSEPLERVLSDWESKGVIQPFKFSDHGINRSGS